MLLIERLAGAVIAVACVLAGLRFAIVRLRSFAAGQFGSFAAGQFGRLARGRLQRLARGPLQHLAGGPLQHLAGGPLQHPAGGPLQHAACSGSGSGSAAGAGPEARGRHGRVLAVLESAYLPGAASVHLVRAGPRLLVIGRSGGAIVTLCELEADAHSHR